MRISKKWRRMADMYVRFAKNYPRADFSDAAAEAMYLHESAGHPLPNAAVNGYALGKKWMGVTVSMWREDIADRQLTSGELVADGYPEWFLRRVGVDIVLTK